MSNVFLTGLLRLQYQHFIVKFSKTETKQWKHRRLRERRPLVMHQKAI